MSKTSRSASRSTRSSTRTRRFSSNPPARSSSNATPPSDALLDSFDLEDEVDSLAVDSGADFAARGRATRKKADPATVAMGAPWVKNGIDYGPARAALHDLAIWALELAEREVADVPADRKHVRNVRGAILGTTNRGPSTTDLMFTSQVLARVFDRDLDLGLADNSRSSTSSS